jgi:hypothetical protein
LLKDNKYYSKIKIPAKIVEEINQTNEINDAKRRNITYKSKVWRVKLSNASRLYYKYKQTAY